MAKPSASYACSSCGAPSLRWVGRCTRCGEYGTVGEVAAAPAATPGMRSRTTGVAPARAAQPLSEVAAQRVARRRTGLGEFDRVLGGGLVAGQVVLVAGEPGVGKSTLLLAVADRVATASSGPALYVSGEESVEQIGERARRIGATSAHLLVADETDLQVLLGHVEQHRPHLVVVDSVQTVASGDVDGRAGGVTQVIEVTQALTRVAKSRRIPMLLVGQSTKENSVAGPRTLEHLVDTVLTFEGDRHTSLRLLRAIKNRYGAADEVVAFEQADDGLREVVDPSALFRAHRESPVPGTCVTITIEGRRPLPVEVQALVARSSAPAPRRGVTGLDSPRVAMLTAVTEQASRLGLGQSDLYVATVGGLRVTDPAADLAVCLAMASAAWGTPMPADVLALGEVALSGDIRPVPMLAARVAEAARLGYRRILVPRGTRDRLGPLPRLVSVAELDHVQRALQRLADLSGPPPDRGG